MNNRHQLLTRMLLRAAAAAIALAVSVSVGYAQEPEPDPRYWIGASGGAASLGDDRCNPELYFVREDSICDNRDGGYKAYAGRALNDYLAAEVFVARLGEASFETTRFVRGFGLAEASLTGRHNISVGGTAMMLIPMKRLDAFLKIGPQW